jgi:hypothetical protein
MLRDNVSDPRKLRLVVGLLWNWENLTSWGCGIEVAAGFQLVRRFVLHSSLILV